MERGETWRSLYASGMLRGFIVLCLGIWLHAADSLVTATIAPSIVETLGGVAYINWTIILYEMGAIVAGAAAPLLYRRLGVKRLLECAVLLYGAGCVLGGLAPSMGVLLLGRLAQGMGGGVLLSLCYLAIQEWFAPQWWSRLFGVVALIWGAGSLLGPLIGGVFADLHAWRMTFVVFAVQAAVVWVMASRWLPRQAPAWQAAKPWPVLPLLVLSAATLLIAQSSMASAIPIAALGCALGVTLLYCAVRLDRRTGGGFFPGARPGFSASGGRGASHGLYPVGGDHRFLGLRPIDPENLVRHPAAGDRLHPRRRSRGVESRDPGGVEGPGLGGPMADSRGGSAGRARSGRFHCGGTGGHDAGHGGVRAAAGSRLRAVLAIDRAPHGQIVG